MKPPFNPKAFLTCPQGQRLEGAARADACRLLGEAMLKGWFTTATEILFEDPSLITQQFIVDQSAHGAKPTTLAMKMDALVLFALSHGVPVDSPALGSPFGLLDVAINQNSPSFVSYALLYGADPNTFPVEGEKQISYLDRAIKTACDSPAGSWGFIHALQIAHMLLDAGADPALPGTVKSALFDLCKRPWRGNAEYNRIFTEIMKRSVGIDHIPVDRRAELLVTAASHGNISATKLLIAAGARCPTEEMIKTLTTNRMEEHIPAITALLEKPTPIEDESARPTDPLPPAQINMAPDGFLDMPQGPQLQGRARADACRLLDIAITEGRFRTATKLLSKDPSLITEHLGEDGSQKIPAVQKAIEAGMTALVPFALSHGISPDDSGFGAPRGLLEVAVNQNSAGLASFALLYRTDPNRVNDEATEVGDPQAWKYCPWNPSSSGKLTILERVIDNLCFSTNVDDKTSMEILLCAMLLNGGATPYIEGEANTAVQRACEIHPVLWDAPEIDFKSVFAEMLERGRFSCVDLRLGGKPAVRIAAESRNAAAVKLLVAAGANIEPEFLGTDLFAIFKETGQGEHLPALAELVIRRQTGRRGAENLAPSVTIVANPDESETAEARPRRLNVRDVF